MRAVLHVIVDTVCCTFSRSSAVAHHLPRSTATTIRLTACSDNRSAQAPGQQGVHCRWRWESASQMQEPKNDKCGGCRIIERFVVALNCEGQTTIHRECIIKRGSFCAKRKFKIGYNTARVFVRIQIYDGQNDEETFMQIFFDARIP